MSTDRDAYLDRLTSSLRVREVPGPRIRELLDEVTGHLDDSGQAPSEAFGEPQDFAAALADGHTVRGRRPARRQELRGLGDGLLVATGSIVLIELGVSVATGGTARVTAGHLVALVAIAMGVRLMMPSLRASLDVGERKVGVVLAVAAAWSAAVAAMLVLDQPLLTLARSVALVAGSGLFAGGVVRIRRSVDHLPPSRLRSGGEG